MLEPLHTRIEPLVVAAGPTARASVVAADEGARLPPGQTRVLIHPRRGKGPATSLIAEAGADGRLVFAFEPRVAGEHAVEVQLPGSYSQPAGSFYVAEPELAGLLPLRGDLHTHTWHSDGRSSPLGLLQRALAARLDFLAVTDHNNFAGTREALAVAPRFAGALTVLPGEEVSFERGHIVAVGTREEVAAWRQRPAFAEELAATTTELSARGDDGTPLSDYAEGVWAARKVRELGGLAFIAHPFWVHMGEYHVDWRVARRLLLEGEVDGVELLGDVDFEDNLLSLAGYMGLLGEGLVTTVLGNSDTHGTQHTFGSYWSLVFAGDDSPEAILAALRERRSVACVRLPGEQLRIYGPLPLVQYAYFLHRRYFVEVEATCAGKADPAAVAAAKSEARRRLLGR